MTVSCATAQGVALGLILVLLSMFVLHHFSLPDLLGDIWPMRVGELRSVLAELKSDLQAVREDVASLRARLDTVTELSLGNNTTRGVSNELVSSSVIKQVMLPGFALTCSVETVGRLFYCLLLL